MSALSVTVMVETPGLYQWWRLSGVLASEAVRLYGPQTYVLETVCDAF